MTYLWIALAVAAVVAVATVVKSRSRRQTAVSNAVPAALPTVPESGLLVPEYFFSRNEANPTDLVDLMTAATVPLAVEYRPATALDLTKYRAVPVNASAQQALADVIKVVGPNQPTLFTVVLPQGGQLVKAVGTSGFRGFTQGAGGRISAQAVLKPVAFTGAAAVSWPVVAVAGAVMAMDMLAQKEQRAYQRRVEGILQGQEQRAEDMRIARQRATDDMLSGAISRMLDGQPSGLETATQRALEEFHLAERFLERNLDQLERLVDKDGKVQFRRLEFEFLAGGGARDVDRFLCELQLTRAALALARKALLADAAASALADPTNPYTALQRHFARQADRLEQAERLEQQLTTRLQSLELVGRWFDTRGGVGLHQLQHQQRFAADEVVAQEPVQYLALPSGEIQQLVPTEDGEGDDEATPEADVEPEVDLEADVDAVVGDEQHAGRRRG